MLTLLINTLSTSDLLPIGSGGGEGNDGNRSTSVSNGVHRLAVNGGVEQAVTLGIGEGGSVDNITSVFAAVDVTEVVGALW